MSKRRAHGEGSIYYEEARHRWVGAIDLGIDPLSGKRRRKTVYGKTRKIVAPKLAALKADAAVGIAVGTVPSVIELYEPWIERKAESVTPATVKMYRDLWSVHVGPIFGKRSVDAITVAEVEKFLTARRHLSVASIRKIRGLLAQVLDEAMRHRVIGFNAARLAALPAGAQVARPQRSLSVPEAGELIEAATEERLGPWLVLALHTGARPGEIAALTWDDLNMQDGTVRIAATKTGTHRTIRLPDHVIDTMKSHRVRLAEERLLMGPEWPSEHVDLVFVSEAGTPLDTANLRRFLSRMSRDAELGWTPTPYTMRHTHASILSDSGVHAEALAQRLGHKDSRTTTAYYVHPVTPVVEVGADLDLRAGSVG